MRRALTLALVAVWAVMVGLLVRKQATTPASDAATLLAAPVRTGIDQRDEWFGVYKDPAGAYLHPSGNGSIVYLDYDIAAGSLGPQCASDPNTTPVSRTSRRTAERCVSSTWSSAVLWSLNGWMLPSASFSDSPRP